MVPLLPLDIRMKSLDPQTVVGPEFLLVHNSAHPHPASCMQTVDLHTAGKMSLEQVTNFLSKYYISIFLMVLLT